MRPLRGPPPERPDTVTPEGRLEHVQPIGAGPHGFDPRSTDTFAVGAFLLAGSDVCRLGQ